MRTFTQYKLLAFCLFQCSALARQDIIMRLNYGVWFEKNGMLETGTSSADWFHIIALPKPSAHNFAPLGSDHINLPIECSMDISSEIETICDGYQGYWNYLKDDYNELVSKIQERTSNLNDLLNVSKRKCNNIFRCQLESLSGQMDSLKNTYFSSKKSSALSTLISEVILLLEQDVPKIGLNSVHINAKRRNSVYASSSGKISEVAFETTGTSKKVFSHGVGLKLYGDTGEMKHNLIKHLNTSIQFILRASHNLKLHAEFLNARFDSLLQLSRGYVTPHIVSSKDATTLLEDISNAILDTPYHVNMKSQRIYSQLSNHFAISMNYVYVAIKIPLVNEKNLVRYTLYRTNSIGLPIINNQTEKSTVAKLSGYSDYLAVRTPGDDIIELSETELTMCQRKTSICKSAKDVSAIGNNNDISCISALFLDLPLTVKDKCIFSRLQPHQAVHFHPFPGNQYFLGFSQPQMPKNDNNKSDNLFLDLLLNEESVVEISCNMCLITIPCEQRIDIGGYMVEPAFYNCLPELMEVHVSYAVNLLTVLMSHTESDLMTLDIDGQFLFENDTDAVQFVLNWSVNASKVKAISQESGNSPVAKIKPISVGTIAGLFTVYLLVCVCTVVFILLFKTKIFDRQTKDFHQYPTEV